MQRPAPARWIARGSLAAIYLFAGIAHLATPAGFDAIVPPWVPQPHIVVAVTGVCEIAGAIGLVTVRFRWWAGVMLALYALCVFPANVHHALANVAIGGVRLGWAYHAPRLLLQPVIIWWALYAGAVTSWPFNAKGRPADTGRPTLPAQDKIKRSPE